MTIEEKLKLLPDQSGVYLMYDKAGDVIYVGKALVLKNRVRSYFMNTLKLPKVQAMVDNVADFSYIVTLSEKDAFSLESNLIKKYKPKYNILLKDDKASPYIRIDFSQTFPTIEIVRRVHFDKKRKNEKLFGPFIGIRAAEMVAVIRAAYKLRDCPKRLGRRACLNYHIGLCFAPCQNKGKDTQGEYNKALEKAVAFLNGRDDEAKQIITQKMEDAVENEDFERCIVYREQLNMIKKLKDRNVADLNFEDLDGVALVSDGEHTAAAVNIIRSGKMMGVKTFSFSDASLSSTQSLLSFLSRFYDENEIPPLICLESDSELNENGDLAALKEYLSAKRGLSVSVICAQKGGKKRAVEMAKRNALEYLSLSSQKLEREQMMTVGAVERLKDLLKINSARVIECYDISNLAGTDTVASKSVFVNGKPEKSLYRRFKIRTVIGSDDYSSMKEVIARRFNEESGGENDVYPDLIVIDGGKGQLAAAHEALSGTKGADIPLISLAKRDEIVYTLQKAISLSKNDYALKVLQRVRDEAHRFAITYNKTLRARKLDSELESIKGVGAKIRAKITAAVPYSELKTLSKEEIVLRAQVSAKVAASIEQYFKNKEGQNGSNKA